MNIDVASPYENGTSGDWLPVVALVWTVIWLGHLVLVLKRADYDAVTRLTWVVVLMIPFFGVILYWCLAPGTRRQIVTPPRPLPQWEENPGPAAKNT